ncbi:class I SAM-dependent methyltransferase [Dactylosporangium sp. NPDC051485]|uniref:class I SAM-dependent methyltransferase n=1 Tax=Dactylosporangium sp. NPDC051485 TaxID=3154846 RepID=UPI0034248BA3
MPEPFEPRTYGDAIADVYDEWNADGPDGVAEAAADFLARCAGERGTALELGIGTGRIAIPLAARGIAVTGVDASPRMVERLRAKPGGAGLPVIVGDLADVPVSGSFDLVYIVASTLYCLTEQQTQVRALSLAAARLRPGGRLVVEAFVPDPSRFDRGQRVEARTADTDAVRLDVARHDPVTQTVFSQQIAITADGIRLYPVHLRYIWPAELDLMARLAGLDLVHRSGGWRGEPYTAASSGHVTVYQRPAP